MILSTLCFVVDYDFINGDGREGFDGICSVLIGVSIVFFLLIMNFTRRILGRIFIEFCSVLIDADSVDKLFLGVFLLEFVDK